MSILDDVRVDCSQSSVLEPQNELERRMIDIFLKHTSREWNNDTVFSGLPVPWRDGGGGFGNSLQGLANTILVSLFTESTMHVHPGIGFYDPKEHPVFRYFRPRNRYLCENMQFPPSSNPIILEKIERGRHYSLSSYLSFKLQKVLGGSYFWEYMLSNPKKREISIFVDERIVSDRNRLLYPHGCFEYVCFDHIVSEKFNRMTESHDFFVLYDYKSGWYPHKVFQSKAKTEYLCRDLGLCKGIDLEAVERYRKHKVIFYEFGFRLISNMFHSLFEFSPEVKEQVESAFGNHLQEILEDSAIMIALNHRNYYVKIWRVTEIVRCLEHVVTESLYRNNNLLKTIKIFISYDGEERKASLIRDRFLENKNRFPDDLNIQFLYNQIGRPEQYGIRGMNPTDENRMRLAMDMSCMYMMSKGDVHVVSEESTFGTFGTILSDSYYSGGERPYVIPSFRSKYPNFYQPAVCSQDIPMQICKERNCPLDYTKEYLQKTWGEEKLKEYSWYQERMKNS